MRCRRKTKSVPRRRPFPRGWRSLSGRPAVAHWPRYCQGSMARGHERADLEGLPGIGQVAFVIDRRARKGFARDFDLGVVEEDSSCPPWRKHAGLARSSTQPKALSAPRRPASARLTPPATEAKDQLGDQHIGRKSPALIRARIQESQRPHFFPKVELARQRIDDELAAVCGGGIWPLRG